MSFKKYIPLIAGLLLVVSAHAQVTPPAYAAYISPSPGAWNPWTSAAGFGAIAVTPPAIGLYCQASAGAAWTPCVPGGGGGGIPYPPSGVPVSTGSAWSTSINPLTIGTSSGPTLPGSGTTGETFLLTDSALQPAGVYVYNSGWMNSSMPNMGIVRFTLTSTPSPYNTFEPVFSDTLLNSTFSFNDYLYQAWLYNPAGGLAATNFWWTPAAINAAQPTSGNAGLGFAVGDEVSLNPYAGGTQSLGVVTAVGAGGTVTTVSFNPSDGGNPGDQWTVQTGIAATALGASSGTGLEVDITAVGPYTLTITMPSASTGYLAFPDKAAVQYFNAGGERVSSFDFTGMSSLILCDVGGGQVTSITADYTSMLYPQFQNNQLSSAQVNAVLHGLVLAGLSNGAVNLQGQTPAAPPTGQGILDAATLTSRGWVLDTD